jgi:hypothetical protein
LSQSLPQWIFNIPESSPTLNDIVRMFCGGQPSFISRKREINFWSTRAHFIEKENIFDFKAQILDFLSSLNIVICSPNATPQSTLPPRFKRQDHAAFVSDSN